MSHPFDRYLRKHGHYPRLKIVSGIQTVRVEFAPGYVLIETYPYGSGVYLTRSAFFQLLRRAVPFAKKWDRSPDFDVPASRREYYLAELEHLDELRQQKRARRGPRSRRKRT